MPRKLRHLIRELNRAGFKVLGKGSKGSHRKYVHDLFLGAVTLGGRDNDDAKHYQEKQVKVAIEQIKK